MNRVPMTVRGAQALKDELEQLIRIERPTIITAISEARAHGDLKENAEYHAARERQGFIEARIREVEGKLSNAQVIEVTSILNEGKVIFGATVTIVNLDTDAEITYHIVGEDEGDVRQGKLSVTSPIARALVGKYVDDEAVVQTPDGEVSYEITAVEYV